MYFLQEIYESLLANRSCITLCHPDTPVKMSDFSIGNASDNFAVCFLFSLNLPILITMEYLRLFPYGKHLLYDVYAEIVGPTMTIVGEILPQVCDEKVSYQPVVKFNDQNYSSETVTYSSLEWRSINPSPRLSRVPPKIPIPELMCDPRRAQHPAWKNGLVTIDAVWCVLTAEEWTPPENGLSKESE